MKTYRIYLDTGAEMVVSCESLELTFNRDEGKFFAWKVDGYAPGGWFTMCPTRVVAVLEETPSECE